MVSNKTLTKSALVVTTCLLLLMLSVRMLDRQGRSASPLENVLSALSDKYKYNLIERFETETATSASDSIRKRLPNCLIIGFSKCGTHALRTFLTLHPSVVSTDLEIGFFNKYYDRGLAWYKEQMPLSLPNQIIIEKTPSYISDKNTILRMHDFDASLKIIILVRDPVVRVQSLYARAVWKGHGDFDKSFEKWLKESVPFSQLIRMGNYAPYVRDVFSIFNEDQILVLDGEVLSRNPAKVLQNCEDFLNLRPIFQDDFFNYDNEKGFFCVNTTIPYFNELMNLKVKTKINKETGCFGESKGRQHPSMSRQLEKYLVGIFRATTEDLFHVIGYRFNWTGFN